LIASARDQHARTHAHICKPLFTTKRFHATLAAPLHQSLVNNMSAPVLPIAAAPDTDSDYSYSDMGNGPDCRNGRFCRRAIQMETGEVMITSYE
jgi:hypothetical protein